ncbi:MAG: hypothetical protein V8S99_01700 [Oscillospiraceae bacterium]
MEIRRLNQKDYAGRKFTARYQTNGYYEICASEQGFRLDYRLFPARRGRGFRRVGEGAVVHDEQRVFRARNGCGGQSQAAAFGARMIVLETQSCNEAAIAFYRKNGFSVIGFDLYAYSNTDPERHEVRIEMGKKLHGPSVR